MRGLTSLKKAEIYMQAREQTVISTTFHPPKVWEQFIDDVYHIL